MQLNERLGQLAEIIASCSVDKASAEPKRNSSSLNTLGPEEFRIGSSKVLNEPSKQARFINLAQFKAFNSAIDMHSLTEQMAQTLGLGTGSKFRRDIIKRQPS